MITRFDACRAEVTFSSADFGTIRADVVGYRQKRPLLIEMWFTHAVDVDKKAKLQCLNLPAIEIYLGDLNLENGFAGIEERVLGSTRHTQWLHHPEVAEVKVRLHAKVDAEVARLNERYAKAQEAQRRRREERNARMERERLLREAERKAREEALAEESRRKQAEVEATYARYQSRPLGEKLVQVRRSLVMQGIWPSFLRFENRHNQAVAAPPKLWQAAVFRHFVFGAKPRPAPFYLYDATAWVRNWFGELLGNGVTLEDAVIGFLAHLDENGFLLTTRTVSHDFAYVVLHSGLSLPGKEGKRRGIRIVQVAPGSRLTANEGASVGHLNDQVRWNPTWPDYESVKRSVTKWVSMLQKDELAILDMLFKDRERLPTPLEFTMQMRNAIPVTTIFNFLRNHAFV